MVRQCCVCKKILRRKSWVDPVPSDLDQADITHGFCDECYEEYKKSLAELRKEVLGGNLRLDV